MTGLGSPGCYRRDFLKAMQALFASKLRVPAAPTSSKAIGDALVRVDPSEVKVAGALGRRIDLTWRKNLLAVNIERDFLQPFRDKQGNPNQFIGLGTMMEAVVRFARHTADTSLLGLKQHLVAESIKAQLPDGYPGMYRPEYRVAKYWDIHETCYIILGLIADWQLFGNREALQAAVRVGDFLVTHLDGDPQSRIDHGEISLELATMPLDRAMLALYHETGNRRYLQLGVEELGLPDWRLDIVEGRSGLVLGHVYAYLERTLAQAEAYRLNGDPSLLAQSRKVLNYLRAKGGLLISGSCSRYECWHSDQSGDGMVVETCATAYLIRLLEQLLRLEGDPIYGDMIERATYNALFAAQSPDGSALRYFTPVEGGREYYRQDTFCCPNNFRRIVAELPQMIYYISGDGLLVNLYTSSSVAVQLKPDLSVRLQQVTAYPNSGRVTIYVGPSKLAAFPLRFRIPSWCGAFTADVNGSPVSGKTRSFLQIEREWNRGDKITLEFDMPWRFVRGFNKQQGRVAVMRGPILFCLNPKLNPGLSGVDPNTIYINPSTSEAPIPEQTLRPDGIGCRLRVRIGAPADARTPGQVAILTEYPDPGGEAVYFRSTDPDRSDADELLVLPPGNRVT